MYLPYVNTSHEYSKACFSKHEVLDTLTAERELRHKFGDTGIYISPLQYSENPTTRESEEYGDLYFDFDSEDPRESLRECLRVADFFMNELDLDEQHIQAFFSGNKGYHLKINAEALGVKRMSYLRNIYKSIAVTLRDKLELETLDLSVYSFGRLFRVANSRHVTSGKYKIWVPLSTLEKRPHFYMEEMATKPGMLPPKFLSVGSPNPEHLKFFTDHRDNHIKKEATTPVGPIKEIPEDIWGAIAGLPVCIEDLLERFILSGQRYAAQARVITYFKCSGCPEEDVFEILWEKVQENYPPSRHEELKAKLHTSVQTIYREEGYQFSCSFVLGMTSYETIPENKVKCAKDACPLWSHCGSGVRREVKMKEK